MTLGALLTSAPPARAEDPSEVAQRIHREGGYDSELPIAKGTGYGSPTTPKEPREPRAPRRRAGGDGSPTLAYLILGAVLASLVGIFLAVLVRWRPAVVAEGEAEARPTRFAGPDAPAPSPIALVEGDPDALAAEGRFEEALAALLLRALRAVGWEPTGRARGATAREVLAGIGVDHPGREPLAGVVSMQERVAFGGEAASRERYEQAKRLLASSRVRSDDGPRP